MGSSGPESAHAELLDPDRAESERPVGVGGWSRDDQSVRIPSNLLGEGYGFLLGQGEGRLDVEPVEASDFKSLGRSCLDCISLLGDPRSGGGLRVLLVFLVCQSIWYNMVSLDYSTARAPVDKYYCMLLP